MTQQFLDVPQICSRFEKMSGEGVTQHMGRHQFLNTSRLNRTLENLLDAALRQMAARSCTGKEPCLWLIPKPIISQIIENGL